MQIPTESGSELNANQQSWFPTLDLGHRESLLQRLFGDGHVRDANGSVTYHL
jgi:hypothetical protein